VRGREEGRKEKIGNRKEERVSLKEEKLERRKGYERGSGYRIWSN
jgi:hypothetical protein